MTNKIFIVTGQTATGKTSLALKLAKQYNGELINCDSRQIYKYLDIITGKDKKLFKTEKIWLYDIVKPDQYFSSFDYANIALSTIKEILQQGKTPILVGGTYLYLKHLLYGIETENIPPKFSLRKKMESEPIQKLQELLKQKNPVLFNNLNNSEKGNRQRLIRKIEITSAYPKIKSAGYEIPLYRYNHIKRRLGGNNLIFELIGLRFKDKTKLQDLIKKRVEERLKMGALAEVKNLLKMGYRSTDPGLKTIGYQQLIAHLMGDLSLDSAIQIWTNKEIQYAKRQLTFMKKDKNIRWQEI